MVAAHVSTRVAFRAMPPSPFEVAESPTLPVSIETAATPVKHYVAGARPAIAQRFQEEPQEVTDRALAFARSESRWHRLYLAPLPHQQESFRPSAGRSTSRAGNPRSRFNHFMSLSPPLRAKNTLRRHLVPSDVVNNDTMLCGYRLGYLKSAQAPC